MNKELDPGKHLVSLDDEIILLSCRPGEAREGCEGCDMQNHGGCRILECCAYQREDKQNVHFKILKRFTTKVLLSHEEAIPVMGLTGFKYHSTYFMSASKDVIYAVDLDWLKKIL